ncbi:type VII secretion protein EccE [Amycolatopsis roodepoortensis]|uniref:type VII secretion protein EccE n=1 Tax=Amycolatopsis roodepoortensis TaxID=700274 RepID=UPI00214CB7C5|nr:type VII secretion protein EccE [Amycolatopsis roodepoortensis]UUV30084.1 type VII secretion protein EccE [Amycolatopsis roodepoortensis]
MTDLGAARTGGRYQAPPPPLPQAGPAVPRTAATPDPLAYAAPAARAAAREAALAALTAARQAEQRPRGFAAVPVPAPMPGAPRPSPPEPVPVRRSGRFGGIGVPQIVCWQLVLVALVLVAGRPWPLAAAVVTAAVVVLALTAVRIRGRWLYAWLGSASGYLTRDRDRDLRNAGEAGRALLRLLSPEATGTAGEIGDETVFMVSRADGVTAVLQPKSAARELPMPAPLTLLPPAREQASDVAAQVIHHVGADRSRPPRGWVALQALRTVDVHRDADVRQALGNTVRRVRRQLRRDGLPVRALAENEVLGVLASLAHVTAGRARIREDWRYWHSGPICQATFRLDGWDALSPVLTADLSRRLLAAAPGAAVTLAVTARRGAAETEPHVSASIRIAAAGTHAVEHAVRDLELAARRGGLTLDRLDGRHAKGVAATLPLGVS